MGEKKRERERALEGLLIESGAQVRLPLRLVHASARSLHFPN